MTKARRHPKALKHFPPTIFDFLRLSILFLFFFFHYFLLVFWEYVKRKKSEEENLSEESDALIVSSYAE